ncbi:chorismate mutase [bacterium]|nr:chorismate mutase [bacterium]
MTTRGIRGATTVGRDTPENVLAMTKEMLESILKSNPDLKTEDIASAIFTTTADITSAFPALAARELGWVRVPMICAQEIPVPGSLPRCIRVLIHWNTEKPQAEIQHIYLHEAKNLRPDLSTQI